MAQGEPTEASVVAEFRAKYLYSGNASKVGRDLKLNERTARRLAEQLDLDDSFSEDVRRLHASALRKHITMRLRVAEVAAERVEEDLPIPENVGEGANITIIDKRADYCRVVLEAEKNAHMLARFEAERSGDIPLEREVIIRVEPVKPKESPPGAAA